MKKYYQENKEKLKEKQKEYYRKNKERKQKLNIIQLHFKLLIIYKRDKKYF